MPNLDHSLIHRVHGCMRGDHVHRVRTWLFLYEKSSPDSGDRLFYECLLRNYVATQNPAEAARSAAETTRQRSNEVCARAQAVNQEVDLLLRAS